MNPPPPPPHRRLPGRTLPALALVLPALLALPLPLRPRGQESYVRENFGNVAHPAPKDPSFPPQVNQQEAFQIMLKSLRDNAIEPSSRRADRLQRLAPPVERAAVEFLHQVLGGANATNPLARAVYHHFTSPSGRQQFVTNLNTPPSTATRSSR